MADLCSPCYRTGAERVATLRLDRELVAMRVRVEVTLPACAAHLRKSVT